MFLLSEYTNIKIRKSIRKDTKDIVQYLKKTKYLLIKFIKVPIKNTLNAVINIY